jgi:hypothetical protein
MALAAGITCLHKFSIFFLCIHAQVDYIALFHHLADLCCSVKTVCGVLNSNFTMATLKKN